MFFVLIILVYCHGFADDSSTLGFFVIRQHGVVSPFFLYKMIVRWRKLDRRTSRTRNEVLPRRSAVCPPDVELVKEHATRLVGERAMLIDRRPIAPY